MLKSTLFSHSAAAVSWGLALPPASSSSSAARRCRPEGSFWLKESSLRRQTGLSPLLCSGGRKDENLEMDEEFQRGMGSVSERYSQEFTFLRLFHLTEICRTGSLHRSAEKKETLIYIEYN